MKILSAWADITIAMGIDETRMQRFDRVEHVESRNSGFIPLTAPIHFSKSSTMDRPPTTLIESPMWDNPNPIASFLSAVLPDNFSFLVNTTTLCCDLSEVLVLSPTIREQLSVDACATQLTLKQTDIEWSNLSSLLRWLLGEEDSIETNDLKSFTSICHELGNADLEMFFFIHKFWSGTLLNSPIDLHSMDISELSVEALNHLLFNGSFFVVSEDAFLEFLLNLGPDYWPLLQHVHLPFLSVVGHSLFVNQLIVPLESIWSSFPCLLKPQLDSLILSDFPGIFRPFHMKHFTLLWRGSRDGFRAVDFHSHCDGHANTLTVILDRAENVFGGFTPVVWESRSFEEGRMTGFSIDCRKSDDSLQSFIFTLKNPLKTPPMIFRLKPECKDGALWMHHCCGPSFGHSGGGCDLCVSDLCNSSRGKSSTGCLGCTYIPDVEIKSVVSMPELLTGRRSFIVIEIEVFEITE
jgi:hypothetical protein